MTPLTRYALIGFLLVVTGLSWINSVLTGRLDKAQLENRVLATEVEGRDKTITALVDASGADRRATEEQLKIEQQKRAKGDAENRKLRGALEHIDAGNQPLPDDVIDILRREDTAPASAP